MVRFHSIRNKLSAFAEDLIQCQHCYHYYLTGLHAVLWHRQQGYNGRKVVGGIELETFCSFARKWPIWSFWQHFMWRIVVRHVLSILIFCVASSVVRYAECCSHFWTDANEQTHTDKLIHTAGCLCTMMLYTLIHFPYLFALLTLSVHFRSLSLAISFHVWHSFFIAFMVIFTFLHGIWSFFCFFFFVCVCVCCCCKFQLCVFCTASMGFSAHSQHQRTIRWTHQMTCARTQIHTLAQIKTTNESQRLLYKNGNPTGRLQICFGCHSLLKGYKQTHMIAGRSAIMLFMFVFSSLYPNNFYHFCLRICPFLFVHRRSYIGSIKSAWISHRLHFGHWMCSVGVWFAVWAVWAGWAPDEIGCVLVFVYSSPGIGCWKWMPYTRPDHPAGPSSINDKLIEAIGRSKRWHLIGCLRLFKECVCSVCMYEIPMICP